MTRATASACPGCGERRPDQLVWLHAEQAARIGMPLLIQIRTVRLATDDEIEFDRWAKEKEAEEAAVKQVNTAQK